MIRMLSIAVLSLVLMGTTSAQAQCGCGVTHHVKRLVANAWVTGPCPTGGLSISPYVYGFNRILPNAGRWIAVGQGVHVYPDGSFTIVR